MTIALFCFIAAGKRETAWTTEGTFIGAWIKLVFARSERISAVDFATLPGYARGKEVRLEFSNNASKAVIVTLADYPSSQRVHIASVTTAWVKVRIKDLTPSPLQCKNAAQVHFYVLPGYGLHVKMYLRPQ